jgi:hypothetical protein
MGKVIKFSNTNGWKDLEKPQPASAFIPDWYKNVESYIGGKKETDGKGGTFRGKSLIINEIKLKYTFFNI